VAGPLNVTAPNPVRNGDLARTLGRVLKRPAVLPVPAMALRVVVGEMAGELVTGQRVFPSKADSLGFAFRYPLLEAALREIYPRDQRA
jgi:NAD dependent epimerase/dehydratase family enzyme